MAGLRAEIAAGSAGLTRPCGDACRLVRQAPMAVHGFGFSYCRADPSRHPPPSPAPTPPPLRVIPALAYILRLKVHFPDRHCKSNGSSQTIL